MSRPLIYLDNASTSLKTEKFKKVLEESYEDLSWLDRKEEHLESLLFQLSSYLGVERECISLVPSSSYAINEIWGKLLDQKRDWKIHLPRGDHISNLASAEYLFRGQISYYSPTDLGIENLDLTDDSVLLVTVKDNLGLSFISLETLKKVRKRYPEALLIGDLTQYVSSSVEREEIFRIFDYSYLSAHKWYGPFGVGVFIDTLQLCLSGRAEQSCEKRARKCCLDWRAIYVWSQTFSEIIERSEEFREKAKNLRSYWEANFPKYGWISWESVPESLIFLVKLRGVNLHDFTFFLEESGFVFRSSDLCSSNTALEGPIVRFSLSPLNEVEELEKLFLIMQKVNSLK
ncbi:selenocysteine lyase/cysteine desulfurase [Candidatus Mycoplasma haematolamae str. Purdue]|uniref:Selenocysteine lyase/cysteine desulfurase n=1 Tax=Mycoplasma haematolamae (strain Purdue) TaxID=1212765 RepID=I7BKN3_MYCHA|nr:selenocysteine lyase/cysteine desulfurase [Candidatus Mycoplasma haematolamae]AFO52443.1 selenocysteine lyase/cysteine desulfurase [Candidatus Mycoplasma haematolamae str. Purdue]